MVWFGPAHYDDDYDLRGGCVYLKEDKVSRVLALYSQLLGGRTIQKAAAAQQYGVNERSIQRDIEDIRAFCRNGMALGDGTHRRQGDCQDL